MKRSTSCLAILLVLVTGLAGLAEMPTAHAAPPVALQLIADQEKARPGDTARYHILLQNNTGADIETVAITGTFPDGLELIWDEGVTWDPATRSAVWTRQHVEAGRARVIHFSARVHTEAEAGVNLPVSVTAVTKTGLSLGVATVDLEVGPAIHQPFFIGFPDGNFRPTAYLTRAEAAALVTRVKQLPPAGPGAVSFSDVPEEHWAHAYISRANVAGYMQGSGERFHPDEPLSRAELVVLLLRLRAVDALPFDPFAETADHWASEAISTAYALNWIEGTDLGEFHPDDATERQVAAKLFAIALYRRSLWDGDVKVEQHFPDVPRTLWSFPWVEEVSMVAHESRTDGLKEYLIRYLPEQTHPL